jgi:hypothetical protein
VEVALRPTQIPRRRGARQGWKHYLDEDYHFTSPLDNSLDRAGSTVHCPEIFAAQE